MRVFCFTSDKYAPLLEPFAYLFNSFWGSGTSVVVVGAKRGPSLPGNFSYSPIGAGYPVESWSDGVMAFLSSVTDDRFVLMLDDYWLCREADTYGVDILSYSMSSYPNVIRMDLTTDVLHGYGDARKAKEVSAWATYDIIEKGKDVPYMMSLQAGIFNRKFLLDCLRPNMTPWDFELYSPIYDLDYRVLGSRQWPVRYINAVAKGNLDWEQIKHLPAPQRDAISDMLKGMQWTR